MRVHGCLRHCQESNVVRIRASQFCPIKKNVLHTGLLFIWTSINMTCYLNSFVCDIVIAYIRMLIISRFLNMTMSILVKRIQRKKFECIDILGLLDNLWFLLQTIDIFLETIILSVDFFVLYQSSSISLILRKHFFLTTALYPN